MQAGLMHMRICTAQGKYLKNGSNFYRQRWESWTLNDRQWTQKLEVEGKWRILQREVLFAHSMQIIAVILFHLRKCSFNNNARSRNNKLKFRPDLCSSTTPEMHWDKKAKALSAANQPIWIKLIALKWDYQYPKNFRSQNSSNVPPMFTWLVEEFLLIKEGGKVRQISDKGFCFFTNESYVLQVSWMSSLFALSYFGVNLEKTPRLT